MTRLHSIRFALTTCLAAGALAAAGCAQKNVTVTGTVVRDGQPIALSSTGVLQIVLVPDVAPGAEFTTFPGRCDAAGKFEIVNVPPGKYRVAIEQLDPTPQTDRLEGAFSLHNTKIVRQIDGNSPLVIDLAKPAS